MRLLAAENCIRMSLRTVCVYFEAKEAKKQATTQSISCQFSFCLVIESSFKFNERQIYTLRTIYVWSLDIRILHLQRNILVVSWEVSYVVCVGYAEKPITIIDSSNGRVNWICFLSAAHQRLFLHLIWLKLPLFASLARFEPSDDVTTATTAQP